MARRDAVARMRKAEPIPRPDAASLDWSLALLIASSLLIALSLLSPVCLHLLPSDNSLCRLLIASGVVSGRAKLDVRITIQLRNSLKENNGT